SRAFIVPYVGLVRDRPALTANPDEVEAILHVPVRELLDPAIFRSERWPFPGLDRPVYFFDLPGDTIWGAAAAMLVNLRALLTGTADRPVPGTCSGRLPAYAVGRRMGSAGVGRVRRVVAQVGGRVGSGLQRLEAQVVQPVLVERRIGERGVGAEGGELAVGVGVLGDRQ